MRPTPKVAARTGGTPSKSASKPGLGVLKNLGGRLSHKLTQWGSKTRANISKLGRGDSDDESDSENSDEEGLSVEFNAERLAKDVQQEVEKDMGEFASSGSASAHSTVAADSMPTGAGATSSQAPQNGAGVGLMSKKFLLQGASMRNLFSSRRETGEIPDGSQHNLMSAKENSAESAGSHARKGSDGAVSQVKAGDHSQKRRGSFEIQHFVNDNTEDSKWISRQDFARRRFTMSSNAWRLHGLESKQKSLLPGGQASAIAEELRRGSGSGLWDSGAGVEGEIERSGSRNGSDKDKALRTESTAAKHHDDFQTPLKSASLAQSAFYRSLAQHPKLSSMSPNSNSQTPILKPLLCPQIARKQGQDSGGEGDTGSQRKRRAVAVPA